MADKILDIDTKQFESIDECKKSLKNNGNGLTVLHMNICSINKHFEELIILINQLENIPDVIVCTETREVNIDLYGIHGNNLYYNEGKINKNDGVITFVKTCLDQEHRVDKIGNCSINFNTLKKKTV